MADDKTIIEGDGPNQDKPPRSKGKSKGKGKGKRQEVTKEETRKGFYYSFVIFKKALRSTAIFDEKEFDNLAKAYVDLANRFPALKFLVFAMAPLATVGELMELWGKLWNSRQPRKKKQKAGPPVVDANYTDVPDPIESHQQG